MRLIVFHWPLRHEFMNSTILYKISSEENLLLAWGKLNKINKFSHGLDNVTIQEFTDNLENKINSISKKLVDGSYEFSTNRAILIPKSNGKYRPLQVPIISDRLVLKAIAIELEEQFANVIAKSEGVSFAYQKKLGVKDAIGKIKEHYEHGNTIVLETDIINFFSEINKEQLLSEQIFPVLHDESLNDLILAALNQPIDGLDAIIPDQRKYFEGLNSGIPQGNPLSPLFSNIYLSPFDIHLKNKGYKLVRYADDFVILCKNEKEAREAFHECENILKKINLKLHSFADGDKTKITDLAKSTFDFLSITFDGRAFYQSQINVNRFKSKVRDICNGKVDYSVLTLLKKVFSKLDGWVSAYYYTDVERYCDEIDYFINRQLFLALRNFDWKFTKTSKGILPSKFRQKGKSPDCLSKKQREKSGIPTCVELLKQKRINL